VSRLLSTLRWDAALQLRGGFYAATGFVTVFWSVVLLYARSLDWERLLPLLLVGNLLVGTFYFIGALVLLERSDGAIQALVVTPLRIGEYLASKVISLTALAAAETLVITVVLRGADFRPLPLLAGTILASAIYSLAGFIAVVRYPSINAFLLPSGIYSSLLWVPLIAALAGWRHWLLALHPITAPLLLAEAAFTDAPWWQVAYGLLYGALWTALLFAWSERAFRRWLVERREV